MKKILDGLLGLFNRPEIKKTIVQTNTSQDLTIMLSCKEQDIKHLDSLTRYYETEYPGIISRGLWLLTIMRNAEINSRKLAIIEVDEESGQVLQVAPITVL